MSLYYVQKLLYHLNRDEGVRRRYEVDFNELLATVELTQEEVNAIRKPDLGLLYVFGVNGQILLQYATFRGITWPDYIEELRHGLKKYGPVRQGLYAETGYEGVDSHTARIIARRDTC